jgi:hypothetical protein
LILKGPTSLNAGFSAGIADEAGLATTFLEAWFIRNSPIKIKGESYLGTFAGLSVSDKDASGLLKLFYTSLRDFSNHLGAPGTKERFILEIANNPEGSARFIGFIRDFNFTEDVKKPYILDYDLEFIGKSFDQVAIGIGKQGAQTSTRMFNGEF